MSFATCNHGDWDAGWPLAGAEYRQTKPRRGGWGSRWMAVTSACSLLGAAFQWVGSPRELVEDPVRLPAFESFLSPLLLSSRGWFLMGSHGSGNGLSYDLSVTANPQEDWWRQVLTATALYSGRNLCGSHGQDLSFQMRMFKSSGPYSVTAFGDGNSKEVTMVKCGH